MGCSWCIYGVFIASVRDLLTACRRRFAFECGIGWSFFNALGWRTKEEVTTSNELARIKRRLPFVFPLSLIVWMTPEKERWRFRRTSGVVMFERRDVGDGGDVVSASEGTAVRGS